MTRKIEDEAGNAMPTSGQYIVTPNGHMGLVVKRFKPWQAGDDVSVRIEGGGLHYHTATPEELRQIERGIEPPGREMKEKVTVPSTYKNSWK
jgi:hypothetical protein